MTVNSSISPAVGGRGESRSIAVWAFNWWCEGLAAALAGIDGVARPRRRFRLSAEARPFVLHPCNERDTGPAIELPDAPDQGIAGEILRKVQGSIIEIIVPPAAIIEHRLDPLPEESRPYVDMVVQHQIDSIFPWPRADVLHSIRVADRADGQLDVSVMATPRRAVASALASAVACGAREVVITSADATQRNEALGISVPTGDAGAGLLSIARYAVASLLVLTAILVGYSTYTNWSLTADLAVLDQKIAERRATLKRLANAGDKTGLAALRNRKQQEITTVELLETLSSILPDDTYLTEMNLDSRHLRISGVSARATEIVPLLEGSGIFKNASFYAPTTRIPAHPLDRFSIEALVSPRAPGAQ